MTMNARQFSVMDAGAAPPSPATLDGVKGKALGASRRLTSRLSPND